MVSTIPLNKRIKCLQLSAKKVLNVPVQDPPQAAELNLKALGFTQHRNYLMKGLVMARTVLINHDGCRIMKDFRFFRSLLSIIW